MSSFQIDTNYEPSPEFSTYHPASKTDNWLLYSYYSGFLFYAMVAIVVSAGVIYNKQKCQVIADGAETAAIVFEVFGYITIILSFVVMIMSILALVYRMGFGEQIVTAYRKLAPKDYDTQFRINQLNVQNQGLVQDQRSTLDREMNQGTIPYSDLQV